jgi:hypothetical protein
MNTRTATTVAITASLAVLLSGCAGAAAGTREASELGLARGHVVEMEDRPLTPRQQSIDLPVKARAWSREAMREFHGQQPTDLSSGTAWSAEARRELKGSAPLTVEQPFTAEVWRELKGAAPDAFAQPFSAEVWRELKGTAPDAVAQPFSAEVWRELKGSTGVSAGGR